MASSKIKKKSTASSKASMLPRQQAIPCLVLVLLVLIVVSVLVFFSLRSAG